MSHNSGGETDKKKIAIKFAPEEEREWKKYKEISIDCTIEPWIGRQSFKDLRKKAIADMVDN